MVIVGITARPISDNSIGDEGKQRIDRQVEALERHASKWAALTISQRIEYLEEVRRRVHRTAEDWVLAACHSKGLSTHESAAGEEWGTGPWALLYSLNRYLETMRRLESDGRVGIPELSIRSRPGGQVIARAFPENAVDNFLLNGVRAEVWMDPGLTVPELSHGIAGAYLNPRPEGSVALVLGAGNISSIAPLDVLHKMLVDHRVVLLKMNPVNDLLGPVLEEIFRPLIQDGYLALAYGGPEIGDYLATHPRIDEIHMTGSDRTHDAIVWGHGAEASERKQNGTPINSRPMTSELGNVTPLIVVPGPWDDADIRFQAEHIATTKLHNAGFNCVATQVLVMPENWDKNQTLLDSIREVMRQTAPRAAYYPGAGERHRAIAESHPNAEVVDDRVPNEAPRMIVTGLDNADQDESLFRQECFVSVLSTTTIPGTNAADYLRNAVTFCNERLWGTLGATILIHPDTIRELGPSLEQSIAELRYGTIGINIWCGIGFLISQLPWGAFPGHTIGDVGSGIGQVHNTKMFDFPQKSVLYGPFYPYPRSLLMGGATLLPKPPWFLLHKQTLEVNKALTGFEFDRDPSWIRKVLVAPMKG